MKASSSRSRNVVLVSSMTSRQERRRAAKELGVHRLVIFESPDERAERATPVVQEDVAEKSESENPRAKQPVNRSAKRKSSRRTSGLPVRHIYTQEPSKRHIYTQVFSKPLCHCL